MLSMVNQHQQHQQGEEPQSPAMPVAPSPSPAQGPVTPPPMVLPDTPPGAPRRPLLQRVSAKYVPRYHHRSGAGQGRPVPPLNLDECDDTASVEGAERTARRRLYPWHQRPQQQQHQHQFHQRNDPPPPSPRFVSPRTPCPTAAESFSLAFYGMRHTIWRVISEHQAAGSTECFVTVPLSLLRAGVLRLFIQKGYRVAPLGPVKSTLQYAMPLIMYRIEFNFVV